MSIQENQSSQPFSDKEIAARELAVEVVARFQDMFSPERVPNAGSVDRSTGVITVGATADFADDIRSILAISKRVCVISKAALEGDEPAELQKLSEYQATEAEQEAAQLLNELIDRCFGRDNQINTVSKASAVYFYGLKEESATMVIVAQDNDVELIKDMVALLPTVQVQTIQ